jgi:NAD+ kinase
MRVRAGARLEVQRCDVSVKWARLDSAPFTDRLVRKFRLPVTGWRGR